MGGEGEDGERMEGRGRREGEDEDGGEEEVGEGEGGSILFYISAVSSRRQTIQKINQQPHTAKIQCCGAGPFFGRLQLRAYR